MDQGKCLMDQKCLFHIWKVKHEKLKGDTKNQAPAIFSKHSWTADNKHSKSWTKYDMYICICIQILHLHSWNIWIEGTFTFHWKKIILLFLFQFLLMSWIPFKQPHLFQIPPLLLLRHQKESKHCHFVMPAPKSFD